MIKIFDTHAHYADKVYDVDRENLLKKVYEDGICDIVLVGASFDESKLEMELAKKYQGTKNNPRFYYSIGDHPDEIKKYAPESADGVNYLIEFENLCKMFGDLPPIAIGEIGLDYHGDFKTEDDFKNQKKWFIAEIEMAKKLNLPIIVHSRDACKDTFDIVKEYAKGLGGIIHCFSYEEEVAKEYIKLGFHIGIGGVITFKNARKTKEVVEKIPIEMIVTETDAPYMAPVPHRGERNNSSYIKYVIEEISKLKSMDIEEASEILYHNAIDVFKLGEA